MIGKEANLSQVTEEQLPPDMDAVDLAIKVYEGLSEEEIDEIERIALDRRNFFSRSIDELGLDEWPE